MYNSLEELKNSPKDINEAKRDLFLQKERSIKIQQGIL